MATTSAVLEDELVSKFVDVFQQFKPLSAHYKKLLTVWYCRLFIKCTTISMLFILGVFHYRNGVFDYNEWAVLYAASVIICVFSSAMQLRRDRKLETYFIEISDAFGETTERLSSWCQANNPSFAKIFKLLLEETNKDRSIDLQTKDLMLVMIFDGIIWFANAVCLLINMFPQSQLQFTMLPFFIVTVLMVAVENVSICMQSKTPDNIDNCYGERKPETNDDSGFMDTSIDFQESHEKTDNLNKTLIFSTDSEQENDVFSETNQKECLLEHHKIQDGVQQTFDTVSQTDQRDTSDANKKETVSVRKINPKNDIIHEIGISSYSGKKCDVFNESQSGDEDLKENIYGEKTTDNSPEQDCNNSLDKNERLKDEDLNATNNVYLQVEGNVDGNLCSNLIENEIATLPKENNNTCENESSIPLQGNIDPEKILEITLVKNDRLENEEEDLNASNNDCHQVEENGNKNLNFTLIKNEGASSSKENNYKNTYQSDSSNPLKENIKPVKIFVNASVQSDRLKDEAGDSNASNNVCYHVEGNFDINLHFTLIKSDSKASPKENNNNNIPESNSSIALKECINTQKVLDNAPVQSDRLKDEAENFNAPSNVCHHVEGNVDVNLHFTSIKSESAALTGENNNNNSSEKDSSIALKGNINPDKMFDIAPVRKESEEFNASKIVSRQKKGSGHADFHSILNEKERAASFNGNKINYTSESDSNIILKENINPDKMLNNFPVQNDRLNDKAEYLNASNNVGLKDGHNDENLRSTVIANESKTSYKENNISNTCESGFYSSLTEDINSEKVLDSAPVLNEAEDLNASGNDCPHAEGNNDDNLHSTVIENESEISHNENNDSNTCESKFYSSLTEDSIQEKVLDIAPVRNGAENFNASGNDCPQVEGHNDENLQTNAIENESEISHKENNDSNTDESKFYSSLTEDSNPEKVLDIASVRNEAEDFIASGNDCHKGEGHYDENLQSTVIENESEISHKENNDSNTCERKFYSSLTEDSNPEKVLDIAPVRNEAEDFNASGKDCHQVEGHNDENLQSTVIENESEMSHKENNDSNTLECKFYSSLTEDSNPEKILDTASVRNEAEDFIASKNICRQKKGSGHIDFHSILNEKERAASFKGSKINYTSERDSNIILKENINPDKMLNNFPVQNDRLNDKAEYLNASNNVVLKAGHNDEYLRSTVIENESEKSYKENNDSNTCESKFYSSLTEDSNPVEVLDIAPVRNEAEDFNASGNYCLQVEGHNDENLQSTVIENESEISHKENNDSNTCERKFYCSLTEDSNPEKVLDIAPVRNETEDFNASGNDCHQVEGQNDQNLQSTVIENESEISHKENNDSNTCESKFYSSLTEDSNSEKVLDIAPVRNETEDFNASGNDCHQVEEHNDENLHSTVIENESEISNNENNDSNTCESKFNSSLTEDSNPEKVLDIAPVLNETEDFNASGNDCHQVEEHNDDNLHYTVIENESEIWHNKNNDSNTCERKFYSSLTEDSIPEKVLDIAPVRNAAEDLNASSNDCSHAEGNSDDNLHSTVIENESETLHKENNISNICESGFYSSLTVDSNPEKVLDIAPVRNETEDFNASENDCHQVEGQNDENLQSTVIENESEISHKENNDSNTCESKFYSSLTEDSNPEKVLDITPVRNETEDFNVSGNDCHEVEEHNDENFHSTVIENESEISHNENNDSNTCESKFYTSLTEDSSPEKVLDIAPVRSETEDFNASGNDCHQVEEHNDDNLHYTVIENESEIWHNENNDSNTCESKFYSSLTEDSIPEKVLDIAPVRNAAEDLNASSNDCPHAEGNSEYNLHSTVIENESETLHKENNISNTCESGFYSFLTEDCNPVEVLDIAPVGNEGEDFNASGNDCHQVEGHNDENLQSTVIEIESEISHKEKNDGITCENKFYSSLTEDSNPEKVLDIVLVRNGAEDLNASNNICHQGEANRDINICPSLLKNASVALMEENKNNNASESNSSTPLKENNLLEEIVDTASVQNETKTNQTSDLIAPKNGDIILGESDRKICICETISGSSFVENICTQNGVDSNPKKVDSLKTGVMTLKNDASTSLPLCQGDYEKSQIIMSQEKLSTEKASTGEVLVVDKNGAKSSVCETDAKRPYVSEKDRNDPNTGCISRKSAGCTTEEKYTSSTFPYSDTAEESGDDVHFVLKKRRPLHIIQRNYVDQRKRNIYDENQLQTTSKTLHTTEQFGKNKIALNYGKLAFCMDLTPESEIELEFKSSGKSRKRSTVYPYKKWHK